MVNDAVERALAYPFALPERSYVLWQDQPLPIVGFSLDPIGQTTVLNAGRQVSLEALCGERLTGVEFVPVLASGSNAAVNQLRHKFPDEALPLPVVQGTAYGICSVYSAHFARYGSIPATVHREVDARTSLFTTFVPKPLLQTLHKSEAVGSNYGFYRVTECEFLVEGTKLHNLYAYLSLHGTIWLDESVIRLSEFDYQGPAIPAMTERQLIERIVAALAPSFDAVTFVMRIIEDSAFRAEQMKRLKEHYRAPSVTDGFERVA